VNKTFPITIGDAGKYTDKPLDMALVLNTPFSIIKTAEKLSLQETHFFSEDELAEIYTVRKDFEVKDEFNALNVVIITMESFSREYVSFFNPDLSASETYTPFLDSLAGESLCFMRAFANGRQSVSALPAICAGIPYAEQTFVSSPYASNEFTGLGNLLSEKEYHTSFFHGANNGSLGLDAFMKRAGYKHYFGKDEYGNNADYDGSWGIRDEAFFGFFADKLNTFPQPFHSVIFSLSSHHPYSLPEHYADSFPKLESPKLRAYRYSDNALRSFFKAAAQSDWYENTLFIITADHGAQSKNPRYANPVGAYAVPIIFFNPADSDLKGTDSTVVQHLDIMPSVLAYLNYEKPFFAFGKNVFKSRHSFGAFINSNEIWQHIRGDYVIQMRNDSVTGRFNYETDFSLENPLKPNDTLSVAEKQLKAFIQTHNYRMIHNKMQLKEK
jgi:phosphoglycerol transferase MdoB-like AlkP superfamily enzyme